MTLLEELKFTQRIAKEHKICPDKVYEFSNQKWSTIEGGSDKQIFWLETRPIATGKNTPTAIDAFISFLQIKW